MYAYCDEHNLPYKKCGKLIVATREEELPRLDALWDRAIANGCEVKMVDAEGIKERGTKLTKDFIYLIWSVN